jgi:hypothetical protein
MPPSVVMQQYVVCMSLDSTSRPEYELMNHAIPIGCCRFYWQILRQPSQYCLIHYIAHLAIQYCLDHVKA